MRRPRGTKKYFLPFMLCLYFASGLSADTQGDEIIQGMDRAMFPENYHAVITMTTKKENGDITELVFESYFKKGTGSRMEIRSPRRNRGIRFLQKDDSLWLYSPRAGSKRAVRLSPRDSFQGSVFSNSDVSDTEFTGKYESRLTGRESVLSETGEKDCLVVESTAKGRDSPYGKVVAFLLPESLIPLRIDYYAHSGVLYKRMVSSSQSLLAGRLRPSAYRMTAFDRPEMYSEIKISKLEEKNDIPDRIFSQADLVR